MISMKQLSVPFQNVKSLNLPVVGLPTKLKSLLIQILLVIGGFGLLLSFWQVISMFSQALPSPFETLPVLWGMLSNPFYDNGPNDKGIGIQVMYTLGRVFSGWALGSLIAIPLGIRLASLSIAMRGTL
jgi:nitrate/nitrite transport system permease protein